MKRTAALQVIEQAEALWLVDAHSNVVASTPEANGLPMPVAAGFRRRGASDTAGGLQRGRLCAGVSAATIRRALTRAEFMLRYQPQWDLRGDTTVAAEALVRWNHPAAGFVLPGQFIADAETSGAIVELGLWVLDAACRQVALWRRGGNGPPRVAVNVSVRQLENAAFARNVADALRRHGLPADALELEITESHPVAGNRIARRVLDQLTGLGVTLALDDFGTGYASFDMLGALPVRTLKLDRSLIRYVADCPRQAATLTAVIDLGRRLGLRVVGEGIETREQLALVRRAGCDIGQGYAIGAPMPAAALERDFRSRSVTGAGAWRGSGSHPGKFGPTP